MPAKSARLLATGTPLVVTLDQDLSSATNQLGDIFQVTVQHDVVVDGAVVVPQGTLGHGRITFVARRGGFGKEGILGLALRDLVIGGKSFALDGHYEEDGIKRHNTAAAAWFVAIGVLAVAIHGGEAVIVKGRALKARTGQTIPYSIDVPIEPAQPAAAEPVSVPTTTG